MRYLARLAVPLALLVMLAVATPAGAQVNSSGMTHLFNSPKPGTTKSDLAFWGNRAYAGDYSGFRIFDITNPAAPTLITDFNCTAAPGTAGQGDISVWENRLVFRSVDTPQTRPDCLRTASPGAGATQTPGWEGLEIFDVSNPAAPQQIAAVATDCGSHTHTLVPDLRNNRLIIYISSYPSQAVSSTPTQWGNVCERGDILPGREHDKLSIIEVPLAAPQNARVIAKPDYNFAGAFNGVPGFTGCHDISVFLELRIAAGACLTEGVMFDISNPAQPVITQRLVNPAIDVCSKQAPPAGSPICLWHSATFTWDGRYVVFGDEAGGGGSAECAADDPPTRGAFWLHRLSAPTNPISSFKIPRVQPAPTQICTAHIMNFVPINGRYVLPSSWYYGGTSVIDWTNPMAPSETAWFEIEPGGAQPFTNTWTTYWYNDYIYANDINRGFDVFTLDVPWRTQAWNLPRFNPQTQENLMRCRAAAHGALRARQRGSVHVQVRVMGQPVVGTKVNLRGAGVRASKQTNASGEVMFSVRPARKGTLRVNVPTALNMVGCQTSRRVAAAPRRAGGGPALTGRPA